MVTLSKIYTKTGDGGSSGLVDGTRRSKADSRFAAIGAVDETNSAIGMARLHAEADLDVLLGRIQNDLFDLGADLARPTEPAPSKSALRIVQPQVDRLEREIDTLNEPLAPLTSFVLPGGSAASAQLHLARTIVRRAERIVVGLAAVEPLNPLIVIYLNRLSDHLFVLARSLNDGGRRDVLWVPGDTR